MPTIPPAPQYSDEEINQALASVYALLLRAAQRKRLAAAQARGDAAQRSGVEAPRLDD